MKVHRTEPSYPQNTQTKQPPKPTYITVLGGTGLNQVHPGAADNMARDRTGSNATPCVQSPHTRKRAGLKTSTPAA